MGKLFETIGIVAARVVEQNSTLLEYVRTHHFKGKVVVVSKVQEKFLPEGEFVADVKGIKYQLNCKDWIQKHIYFDTFERREIATALQYVRKGGVYFDVGANIGFYALNFAKKQVEAEKSLLLSPTRKRIRNLCATLN